MIIKVLIMGSTMRLISTLLKGLQPIRRRSYFTPEGTMITNLTHPDGL
jgi:hypothetical protein